MKKYYRLFYIILAIAVMLPCLVACDGTAGESAYDIAVKNGFIGNESEWLDSLKGETGASGFDGSNGATGQTGPSGKDGIGVDNIKTDENGNLIITLTDGNKINAGYVGIAEPDNSDLPPMLNITALNIVEGSSFLLVSDRPGTVFTSSAPDIIQVTEEGLVVAAKEGAATVVAKARNGKTAECIVNSFSFTYSKLSDGTLKIESYYGGLSELVIPENIKGDLVTVIGEKAFFGNDNLTSVTLTSKITEIEENAFTDCSSLAEVSLPENIECAENAFNGTPWNNADTEDYDTVRATGSVSIRSTPEFGDNIVGYAQTGNLYTRYDTIQTVDGEDTITWAVIGYNEVRCYVSMKYLEVVPNETQPQDVFEITPSVLGTQNGQSELDYINNNSTYIVDKNVISSIDVSESNLSEYSSQSPLVLIYHTHTSEAFTATGVTQYNKIDNFAISSNNTENVVAIGKIFTDILNENGIPTVHCETLHDTDYNSAYNVSATSISSYLEEYPTIKYVIDIHRDSVRNETNTGIIKPVITTESGDLAQVMCVVAAGTEETVCGRIQENLALAQLLRAELNGETANLCRPTALRADKVYNQNLAEYSLLIELGADANTLEEATASAHKTAAALVKVIKNV